MIRIILLLSFSITLLLPSFGYSQAQRRGPKNFVALGIGATSGFVGSDRIRTIPFGAAQINTEHAKLYWRGISLGADFLAPLTKGRVLGGAELRYSFAREDSDSIRVDALPDIDSTIFLGAFLGYRWKGLLIPPDSLTLRLRAEADPLGVYDGFNLSPSLSFASPVSDKTFVILSSSLTYGESGLLDTIFGVSEEGSKASGLPSYKAGSGVYRVGTSIAINHELSGPWGLFALLRYSRLRGEASASPVVELEGDENQFLGGLAVVYSF